MPGRHRRARPRVLLAIVGALVLVLTILVVRSVSDDQDPRRKSGGPVSLTFAAPPDFSASGHRRWVTETCYPNHPSNHATTVSYVELSPRADDQRAELMTKLQSESPVYDVLGLDVTWTQEFAKAGLIRPLDELAGQEVDLGRFFPPMVDTVRHDGKAWAVPLHVNAGLLYYNTDYVSVDEVPTTWKELERFLRDLERPEGVAGYVTQLDEYEGLRVNASELAWGHGGAFVDPDGEVTAGQDGAVEGLAFLARGLRDGWIPREALTYTEQASLEAFRRGDAVFLRHWPYAGTGLAAADSAVRDRFGVAPLPGPNAVGGVNLAVSKFSEHPEAAYEFIRFMTGKEVQQSMFRWTGRPTAISAVYQDEPPDWEARISDCAQPGGQGANQTAPPDDRLLDALDCAFPTIRPRPAGPYYEHVTQLIQEAAHDVLARQHPEDDQQLQEDIRDRLSVLAEELRAARRGR